MKRTIAVTFALTFAAASPALAQLAEAPTFQPLVAPSVVPPQLPLPPGAPIAPSVVIPPPPPPVVSFGDRVIICELEAGLSGLPAGAGLDGFVVGCAQ